MSGKKEELFIRAKAIHVMRQFFFDRGYLEVETPNLINAPAPELHIDAIKAGDGYLHTSPEIYMKRLLCAGHKKIFQISKCFRKGERGRFHLPEFTMLEWYHSGIDYLDLMKECEEMIFFVAGKLRLGDKFEYIDNSIELKRPWERITIEEAFNRYSRFSLQHTLDAELFDVIMIEEIEPRLSKERPVFLYNYPASLAALAQLKHDDCRFAERFELYMGGIELANAFSELTDAKEQAKRFKKENEKRRLLGKQEYPIPYKFLGDLSNMPKAAGIALGIDRLVMLFTNNSKIDNVVTFTPEEQ